MSKTEKDSELMKLVQAFMQQISIAEFRDELGHLLTKNITYEALHTYLEKTK